MNLVGELLMEDIDGGLRVKRAGPLYVDVLTMLFSYRVVATPVDFPLVYGRFYCYAGTSLQTFATAVCAAQLWDPTDGSEPLGWNKNGQTQVWREPGRSTLTFADWEKLYAHLEEDE